MGPGKYDPRTNLDGKSTPLVIPPAYGLNGVASETYTAGGPVSYWNAYVAVTQMHAHGHDGSAATLADVVSHYVVARSLKLTAQQRQDLVEYLKTL